MTQLPENSPQAYFQTYFPELAYFSQAALMLQEPLCLSWLCKVFLKDVTIMWKLKFKIYLMKFHKTQQSVINEGDNPFLILPLLDLLIYLLNYVLHAAGIK